MNKNECCESSCLSLGCSAHDLSHTTKMSLVSDPGPSPASELSQLLCVCVQIIPRQWQNSIFFLVPTFPSFESRNLVIATELHAFIPSAFRVLFQSQNVNSFRLGSLFLSPSVPPPHQGARGPQPCIPSTSIS